MGEKELAGWFRKLGLFTQSPLDYQRISKISVEPPIEGGDITVTWERTHLNNLKRNKMKNIHVLPTDNYSPLVHSTNKYGGYFKSEHYSPMKEMGDSYQNIYITSDEEIRDVRPHKGKWHLEGGNILNKFPNYLTDLSECKLVIMTTDQELIKDGVQAIEDEFLDFFVENPTFESIVVERLLEIGNLTQLGEIFDITESWKLKGRTLYYCGESKTKGIWKLEEELTVNKFNNIYRIIIPKVDFSFFEGKSLFFKTQETAEGCTCDDSPDLCDYCEDAQILKEAREQAMGKKSLEEAARVYENSFNDASGTESTDFIEGAKWQAEQLFKDDAIQTLNAGMSLLLKKIEKMYSQEEVSDLIEDWTKMASGLNMNFPRRKFNNWFEQFKKK